MHKLRYHPGDSIIHRLYPVTKLAWLLIGSILVFIIDIGVISMLTASILMILLIVIYPDIWAVRGFRFALFTGCLYLVFVKSGELILDPGIDLLKFTNGGLNAGLLYSGRFFAVIFLSYIFVLTTEPSALAYALMRLGVPYRFGFMLVTALGLAPILEDEGRTIYRAQLARGIRYDRSGLKKILLLTRQFLTPLLISSLRRADRLFFSMEGRGFGRSPRRTFLRKTLPTRLDLLSSLIFFLFFGFMVIIGIGGFI